MNASMTLPSTALVAAVEAATYAPSMHNSQPWRFRLAGNEIEVRVDRARVLPVADPTWRAARLACGAAVFNLRLALAMQHRSCDVLPGHGDATLVARVALGPERVPTPEERELFTAIRLRRSNRYPFLPVPVPLDVRARLRVAAQRESAWLDFLIGPAAIDTASELVRAADRRLAGNPDYQAEIARWTRHGDEHSSDGVPEAAGGPAPQPHELLARRDFGSPKPSRHDYESEPVIGVLGGFSDAPADHVAAGQALQRVLLSLTRDGLVASLISQPIEVPEIREQLRIGLGRFGPPQIMLRIGYGTPGPSAPRRPATDAIDQPDN